MNTEPGRFEIATEPGRGRGLDRLWFGLVLLVWLQCLIASQVFIAAYAPRTPYADDIAMFYMPGQGVPLHQYLWSLHNEHRLPLPKIVQWMLYRWTGDVRSGMFVQAQIYGAIALACVLVARRLRGASRPWDAFFPLMWLQLGNSENLLMGFQLCIAIPGAAVCCVLFLGALSPRRLWPSRALPCGLALVSLPLCGGGGLLQAPALGAWMAWLGWTQRRHPEARQRLGARVLLLSALLAGGLCVAYLIGFERPPQMSYVVKGNPVWKMALANLCAPFGPSLSGWRPLLQLPLALAALALGTLFARRAIRDRDPGRLGVLAVMLAGAMLVGGIARGRPVEGPVLVANRYIPLPAPFYVALSLGALAFLGRRGRELVLAGCCLLMALVLPNSTSYGIGEGRLRQQHERELDQLIDTRASWARVHAHYTQKFVLGMSEVAGWLLTYFMRNGLPPFDHGLQYTLSPIDYPDFDVAPREVRFKVQPVNRYIDGELTTCIRPWTIFELPVTAHDRRFSCIVGVPSLLLGSERHPGVRARVVLRNSAGGEKELGCITLDPVHFPADRGMLPFEYTWEPGAWNSLILSFERILPPGGREVADWVGVRKLHIE